MLLYCSVINDEFSVLQDVDATNPNYEIMCMIRDFAEAVWIIDH